MLNTTSGYEGSHPMTSIKLPWSLRLTPSWKGGAPHDRHEDGDTLFKAMKKEEIEMLDNIWKRVKNN